MTRFKGIYERADEWTTKNKVWVPAKVILKFLGIKPKKKVKSHGHQSKDR